MNTRQYTWMVALALIAGLIGGLVSSQFLIGQPVFAEKKSEPQKAIEAQEFRLVDAKGKLKGILATEENGSSNLRLMDEIGDTQVLLTATRFSPNLKIGSLRPKKVKDKNTESSDKWNIVLLVLNGEPTLNMDAEDGFRADLSLLGPYKGLVLADKKGLGRAWFVIDKGVEEPFLSLWDEKGLSRAVLGSTEIEVVRTGEVRKRPISSLVFFSDKGKVIWEAP